MSITIDVSSTFPDGTVVGAYLYDSQPSNADKPSGAAAATATVASGNATFSGLTEDATYLAIGSVSGTYKRLGFTVNQEAPTLVDLSGYATLSSLSSEASTRSAADDGIRTAIGIVEDYGAVGDGATDDTTALRAAIATGRPITLTPGATYLCRGQLTIETDGQSIDGKGATIKRAEQFETTTNTTITSGSTDTITLASVSGLEVGDIIIPEKSGNFDHLGRVVESIVGSVVTVESPFALADVDGNAVASATGPINIYTGYNQVSVLAKDVRITDLVLDGNSSNWTWGRWQHTAAVITGVAEGQESDNFMMDHCKVINQFGDGIDPGGPGNVIAHNWIENIKGRGIVFSGMEGTPTNIGCRCVFNHVIDCNTDVNVGGHDGLGSIDFSQGGPNTLIEGNYISGGYDGIHSAVVQNASMNIIANEILDMTRYGMDFEITVDSDPHRSITIRDNEIDTAEQGIFLVADGSATTVVERVSIVNNEFRNITDTHLQVGSDTAGKIVGEVQIEGNTLYGSGTTQTLIQAYRGENTIIRGNTCLEGGYGIDIPELIKECLIANNLCHGQYTWGISVGDGNSTGVVITGNRVRTGASADGSAYMGIRSYAPGPIVGNYVDPTIGADGAFGIVIYGQKHFVESNYVGEALNTGILAQASSTYSMINNNYVPNGSIYIYALAAANGVFRRNNVLSYQANRGVATLVAGTVTVSTQEIRTGDNVILSRATTGGTVGHLSLGTVTDSTSFVINSSSGTDTSTVYWEIRH